MTSPDIAVVIPHYQKTKGLLGQAVQSAFAQSVADRLLVIVCDDTSPSPAADELASFAARYPQQLLILKRPNGGAGAARNTALDAVPAGFRYVAYLDSDDAWRPDHIENAVHALELGHDAYFSNFIGVGYPDVGHFERVGNLFANQHPLLDAKRRIHALGCSALEHTVADGGGLIGTPTVVYRFDKYPHLRFREEFYNGQDFFFWMDLSELGASFVFSFNVECDNGTGVNIYQASGWGSEKSLQRLRNELFVWTSVERFYKLSPAMLAANRRTIRNLQEGLGRDVLHRLRHGKPVSLALLRDIFSMAPSSLPVALMAPLKMALARLGTTRPSRG
jgi:succinoglycan biosynthesis protein ExoW